jgi:hypothetical protein
MELENLFQPDGLDIVGLIADNDFSLEDFDNVIQEEEDRDEPAETDQQQPDQQPGEPMEVPMEVDPQNKKQNS